MGKDIYQILVWTEDQKGIACHVRNVDSLVGAVRYLLTMKLKPKMEIVKVQIELLPILL